MDTLPRFQPIWNSLLRESARFLSLFAYVTSIPFDRFNETQKALISSLFHSLLGVRFIDYSIFSLHLSLLVIPAETIIHTLLTYFAPEIDTFPTHSPSIPLVHLPRLLCALLAQGDGIIDPIIIMHQVVANRIVACGPQPIDSLQPMRPAVDDVPSLSRDYPQMLLPVAQNSAAIPLYTIRPEFWNSVNPLRFTESLQTTQILLDVGFPANCDVETPESRHRFVSRQLDETPPGVSLVAFLRFPPSSSACRHFPRTPAGRANASVGFPPFPSFPPRVPRGSRTTIRSACCDSRGSFARSIHFPPTSRHDRRNPAGRLEDTTLVSIGCRRVPREIESSNGNGASESAFPRGCVSQVVRCVGRFR